MPDSLLSRFDLLFVMLDEKDPENDRKIASRVIANHRYQLPNGAGEQQPVYNLFNDDNVIEPDFDLKDKNVNDKSTIYEKSYSKDPKGFQVVTREFLKKYISYAKAQKSPEIHMDCVEQASQFYAVLRTKA